MLIAPAANQVELWAPQIAELLLNSGVIYVAGGAARQLVMGDDAPPAEDIDLFLRRERDYDRACADVQKLGYVLDAEIGTAAIFLPRDADADLPVQVIRPHHDLWTLTYGTPEVVIDHFSFTTEQFAVLADGALITGASSIEDTRARRLVVHNITDPVTVGLRVAKYAAKGYHISADELERLFTAYAERMRHA